MWSCILSVNLVDFSLFISCNHSVYLGTLMVTDFFTTFSPQLLHIQCFCSYSDAQPTKRAWFGLGNDS